MKFTLALALAVSATSAAIIPDPVYEEPTTSAVAESSYAEEPVPESTYAEEPVTKTHGDDGPQYSMFSLSPLTRKKSSRLTRESSHRGRD